MPTDLFGQDHDHVEQDRLFAPPARATAHVVCGGCGQGFDVPPTTARIFERCDDCRRNGVAADRLFVEGAA